MLKAVGSKVHIEGKESEVLTELAIVIMELRLLLTEKHGKRVAFDDILTSVAIGLSEDAPSREKIHGQDKK